MSTTKTVTVQAQPQSAAARKAVVFLGIALVATAWIWRHEIHSTVQLLLAL